MIMTMTQEEARTKWCPMARDTCEGVGSYNRNSPTQPLPKTCMCLADECACWVSTPDLSKDQDHWFGRCGLIHT
jgi:hypothetical protein